jgi:deoxyribodipyrimidine photo-lyase
MIQQQRIHVLNDKAFQNNKFIVYWMQQSQRTQYNHALEYAISQCNRYEKPLLVYFGVTDRFPDANSRHYSFMFQGLQNVEKSLHNRGIGFLVEQKSPEQGVIDRCHNACMIVVDKGYLKIQRQWRSYVAERCSCPVVEVESDVIVPVEVASNKEEYSAGTIRSKIHNYSPQFLKVLPENVYTQGFIDHADSSNVFDDFSLKHSDSSVKPVDGFSGGTVEAKKRLNQFISDKLDKYPLLRNNPNLDMVSNLSAYLHFGQISSLYIALEVLKADSSGGEAFLDELLIRRELAVNFVYYNKEYDRFSNLPQWAKTSLHKHESDKREYIYTVDEFEAAQTHDAYWNAAQKQMSREGKMHGYMRMYWGKKILEWTQKPQDAFDIALYLNNTYELDGRDANGYAGVSWCFGKHDRAWGKRPVFGNVRYMNASGLKRKFDIEAYAKRYNE